MLLDDRKHLEKMVEKCQEVLIASQPADEKIVDVKKPQINPNMSDPVNCH